MTFVPIEKCEALDDPGVEAAADMLGYFLDNVTAVFEPGKLRPGRNRKDGFFTFFAMISELHRPSIHVRAAKASVSQCSFRVVSAHSAPAGCTIRRLREAVRKQDGPPVEPEGHLPFDRAYL